MACGVPVMGCRGISLEEAIPKDAWGDWLVPPHDATALADRIRKWVAFPDRRKVPTLTGDFNIDHLIPRWLDFVQTPATGETPVAPV